MVHDLIRKKVVSKNWPMAVQADVLNFYPPTQKTTAACRNALRPAGTGFARGAP